MRLRGLVRKEFLQILRDPSSIAIAFLMPVLLLFLFGYGVSLDAEHVPVGIVVEKPIRILHGLSVHSDNPVISIQLSWLACGKQSRPWRRALWMPSST